MARQPVVSRRVEIERNQMQTGSGEESDDVIDSRPRNVKAPTGLLELDRLFILGRTIVDRDGRGMQPRTGHSLANQLEKPRAEHSADDRRRPHPLGPYRGTSQQQRLLVSGAQGRDHEMSLPEVPEGNRRTTSRCPAQRPSIPWHGVRVWDFLRRSTRSPV